MKGYPGISEIAIFPYERKKNHHTPEKNSFVCLPPKQNIPA